MARVRLTRQRVKRALILIPAMAILGALLWPAGAVTPGPTVVSAVAAASCIPIVCSPASITSPTSSPSPTSSILPTASPSPRPTQRPTPPPSAPSQPPPVHPAGSSSSSAIGSAPGPPPPPSVTATSISIASEPANPQPGASATLVITVSGQNGADRYGVSGKGVDLVLKQSPGPDAKLDATGVTTDASGAATVKLTLSQTRGRHLVDATSEGLSTEWVTDTLAGANLISRARHGGEIDVVPAVASNASFVFFAAAVLVLLLGFAWPYGIGRWRQGRRQRPLGPRQARLRTTSKRTP